MKLIAVLVLFFCSNCYAQQKLVEGVVTDEYGRPMPDCKVFIGHTCFSFKTDASGKFSIKYLPPGKEWALTIYKEGYDMYRYPFTIRNLPLSITANLNRETVRVRHPGAGRPDNWEKWGTLFSKTFLGESENARFCTIENVSAIKFEFDERSSVLRASCSGMIIITNSLLGYTVNYRLDEYQYNFLTSSLFYSGVPFFEELEDTEFHRKQFSRRRLKAYRGSTMHFVRSVYNNRLSEEGFAARFIERRKVVDSSKNAKKVFCCVDSLGERVFKTVFPMKLIENIGKELNAADLVSSFDSAEHKLSFKGLLDVVYSGEREAPEYINYTRGKKHNKQHSTLRIINDERKISINASGYYWPSYGLETGGYMSWEKVADLIPIDYDPENETTDSNTKR